MHHVSCASVYYELANVALGKNLVRAYLPYIINVPMKYGFLLNNLKKLVFLLNLLLIFKS